MYCVAGREAMEAATKAVVQSAHSRPRLSSMSSMKSIGNVSSSSEPDLEGLVPDEKERALCVPPLPMYALLAADKDTSGSGSATAGIPISLACHVISIFFECQAVLLPELHLIA